MVLIVQDLLRNPPDVDLFIRLLSKRNFLAKMVRFV